MFPVVAMPFEHRGNFSVIQKKETTWQSPSIWAYRVTLNIAFYMDPPSYKDKYVYKAQNFTVTS